MTSKAAIVEVSVNFKELTAFGQMSESNPIFLLDRL